MFEIQRFGNNDIVTTTNELKVNLGFTDADTRLVNLKNPKTNLTAEEISNTFALIKPTDSDISLLVGDKNGADYSVITEAYTLETTDRKLDLS